MIRPSYVVFVLALIANQAYGDKSYVVELSLTNIASGEYKKPYTAIWVADSKNKPLRVLQVWREKERWLKDLKHFWRRVLRQQTINVDELTGATRGPGKYTLHWDGKDTFGNELSADHYKVCAEVSREHGSHTAKCLQFRWPLTERTEIEVSGEFTHLMIRPG